MKKFAFSLQRLLNLREFQEKEAEVDLGKAIAVREAIQLELDTVAAQRVSTASSRHTNTSIQDLLAIEQYIARLDIKKEDLLQKLTSAEMVVESKREKYIAATRDRRVISKLREKKMNSWHKEVLNEEASVLDDITNFSDRKI